MRCLFLLAICCSAATAAEPRLDPYGDPLPEGAIARIGSTRLHLDTLSWASITEDGKRIVSGGMYGEKRISVWDATSLKLIKTIPIKEENETWAVAVSPDGKLAAAVVSSPGKAEFSMSALVWEIDTGKQIGNFFLGKRNSGAEKLVFSADNKKLGVICEDLRVIEIATGAIIMMTPHSTRVQSLTFARDSFAIFAGGVPKLQLWDGITGRPIEWDGKELANLIIDDQALTPDGKFLFVAAKSSLHRFKVQMPTKQGETIKLSDKRSITVSDAEKKGCWASPDGSRCVVYSKHGDVEIGDFTLGRSIPTVNLGNRSVFGVAFSQGGLFMLTRHSTNDYDRALEVVDLIKRKFLTQELGLKYTQFDAHWLADGKRIRTDWQLWDAANGKFLGRATASDYPIQRSWKPPNDRQFVLSPDGKVALVAVGGRPRTLNLRGGTFDFVPPFINVEVWDAIANQRLRTFRGRDSNLPELCHFSGANSLSFDGRLFVSCDLTFHTHMELWDTTCGRMLALINNTSGGVGDFRSWTISADGRRVLIVGAFGVGVFDVRSRNLESFIAYRQDEKHIVRSAFSSDGRLAASTPSNGEVAVFDLHERKIVAQLKTEQKEISRVEFSPNGRQLLTQGQGGWVHVWPSPKLAPPPPMWEKDYEPAWKALLSLSAADTVDTMNRWSRSGLPAVEYIAKHLETPKGLDEMELNEKIDQLGAKEFRVRTEAQRELSKRGEPIVPLLQKRLANERDSEIKERLQKIIDQPIKPILPPPSPELLRALRAVEILERIGTPAAKAQIQRLAKGVDSDPLTMEAQATLRRMN